MCVCVYNIWLTVKHGQISLNDLKFLRLQYDEENAVDQKLIDSGVVYVAVEASYSMPLCLSLTSIGPLIHFLHKVFKSDFDLGAIHICQHLNECTKHTVPQTPPLPL